MIFFRPCVYDVEGLTVAVHPGTQIVVRIFACVTSAKKTPGGSRNGDRGAPGVLRSAGISLGAGVCSAEHAESSASAAALERIDRTGHRNKADMTQPLGLRLPLSS